MKFRKFGLQIGVIVLATSAAVFGADSWKNDGGVITAPAFVPSQATVSRIALVGPDGTLTNAASVGSSLVKGNGSGGVTTAASGTDYAPATSGSAILKGNGSGGFSSAAAGTDYIAATSGSAIQKANGSGGLTAAASGTDYAPATSGSAILKGNGSGGFSSAAQGTDYYAPGGTDVAIADGGTGASTANAALDNLNAVGETTVASATTTDLGAVASQKVSITGTTTITGFGTVAAGTKRMGRFTGALTLTHNATSLILPGGANITTAAGDSFLALSLGSGNWVVYLYQKTNGKSVVLPTLASADFANQGTTATVLHGNASGNPSFGAVSLTADVTGTLGVGNGGTGASTANTAQDNLNAVGETTVASATTTDLGAVASQKVSITGTTTITSFGTVGAGTKRMGRFTGALTLTHNATSLILPGGANITTAAGDSFLAISLGSGNWAVYLYQKANGKSIVLPTLASVDFANQGTTTTVLHGNGSGNPSFGAVSLTADVTGTLGLGNGGTGQTTANAAADALQQNTEASVASATTTDLGAQTSQKVSITGTTTITGFGTVAAGTRRSGRFTGALTLTHNATSLILPGGANITTAAGDSFDAVSLGSGNWVVYCYQKANGKSIVLPTLASADFANQGTTTTVLHGNGSGNPSFGAVSLTADVTGTLGLGNGGTGQTTANAAADALQQNTEASVASATTTDLGAQTSQKVSITGTTTITGFGTVAAGTRRSGRFTGALTLTHNATSLILPGGRNITTAAGDSFDAVSLGSGNWAVYCYTKANGHSASTIVSSQTYDPGNLTTSSVEVQTWTVTGVAAGDTVIVGHPSITAPTTSAYWDFRGFATATDTVVTRLQNNTGGTVNLATGTMKITVFK